MAVDDSHPTLHEQVRIGGTQYDITAKEFSDGMYRATWTCSTCKEEGAWAPVSADPRQAIKSAIIGLEVHHAFVHGISKTNPPHLTRKHLDDAGDSLD